MVSENPIPLPTTGRAGDYARFHRQRPRSASRSIPAYVLPGESIGLTSAAG
jgi:hypothetical protein